MKYASAQILALAGLSNAVPHPQLNFPGLSLPSFPAGGFGSLPAATGIPSFGSGTGGGFDWTSLLGGFGGGLGGTTTTAVQVTAIPATTTGAVATPTGGNTGGTGTIGANCTPQGSGSSSPFGGSENGITDKNCCTDMTVIFARGTGETGNVGTISGPPMFKAIRSKLGNNRVTVQGVDYPASAAVSTDLFISVRGMLTLFSGQRQLGC